MCIYTERKKVSKWRKTTELRELPGLESVSLLIKKSTLRWTGHVEHLKHAEWVKQYIPLQMDTRGTRLVMLIWNFSLIQIMNHEIR